jgi:23S rRNA pseudouridine1911/1915/1917 synthase
MAADEQEITLTSSAHGERVDRFLAASLPDASRGDVQRWIKEERVSVNGRLVKPSHKLAAGDVITLLRPPLIEQVIEPEEIPLVVVYEDADLLVVDKPAGMVVHPAPGHMHGTLVNALLARYSDLHQVGGPERAGIVHRLDRDTSGLIIVAKTLEAHRQLQRQFRTRRVLKTYLALVEGYVETLEGRVEAPIGRDPAQRKRMAVIPQQRGGRPAISIFRLLGHFEPRLSSQRLGYSLLEIDLLTGRTHQIRVHMAFLKHPVVGDRVYGRRKQRIHCPRQFLHAHRLSFKQPTTGAQITVEAPLASDLGAVMDAMIPVS